MMVKNIGINSTGVQKELATIPVYPSNNKYLHIREIAEDGSLAVIPDCEIVSYNNALLTPLNQVFVGGRYVSTGLTTLYNTTPLSGPRKLYLFLKFRFLLKVERHRGRFLFAHDIWSNNYYHWQCEVLPRLATMSKEYPGAVIILPQTLQQYAFVSDSLRLLNLPYQWVNPAVSHICSKLVTVQCSPPLATINPLLQHSLRQDLLRAIDKSFTQKAYRKIYISRQNATYRKLDNEHEIVPVLLEYGYEIIQTETLSYQEQITLLREASFCIALHGAGLTNCMFMQPGARVMEIRIKTWSKQPLCYWRLANLFNLHWSYHLAQSVGEESNFNNISIDPASFREDLQALHS